jgi:hypothetical protein
MNCKFYFTFYLMKCISIIITIKSFNLKFFLINQIREKLIHIQIQQLHFVHLGTPYNRQNQLDNIIYYYQALPIEEKKKTEIEYEEYKFTLASLVFEYVLRYSHIIYIRIHKRLFERFE